MSTKEKILPGRCYHLYNHANGNLNLFRNEENFRFFLEKYIKYVHPFVDTYAYCLMPNHFHFLIRVKEERKVSKEGSEPFKGSEPSLDTFEEVTPLQVTNSIKNWLISYTNSYHKVFGTKGNLYYQKVRRKLVTNEAYLLILVGYIHLNPIVHGFTKKAEDWKHSSFPDYLNESLSFLNVKEMFDLYGDKSNFFEYHDNKIVDFLQSNIDMDF